MKLMGTAEIATRLGVSRQRAHQITSGKTFPDPVASLAAGNIWNGDAVEKWIAEHRPDKATPTPASPPARPKVGLDGFCRGCQEPAAYCTCGR